MASHIVMGLCALGIIVGLVVGVVATTVMINYKLYSRSLITIKDANGTEVTFRHPNWDRFCHICGADSHKKEPCDSGLHS